MAVTPSTRTKKRKIAENDPTAEAVIKTVVPSGDNRSLLEIAQQYSAPGLAVHVRLEGIPPGLLMHSANSMKLAKEAEEKHRKEGKRNKFIPEARQEAEWGLYSFETGVLYLPCKNILRAMVEAAKAFKMPKSRATMWKAAAAGITTPLDAGLGFELRSPETNEPMVDWEVDTQRAVVSKAAIMRSRPLIDHWAVEADFQIDPEAVPIEVFAQIIGYAGSRVGCCDNRPEKGGQNGRWMVTGFELTDVASDDLVPVAPTAAAA